jgi:uncharacterized membrane protein YhaH (DUF805 family)
VRDYVLRLRHSKLTLSVHSFIVNEYMSKIIHSFNFTGRLDRHRFLQGSTIRIGLYAAVVVAYYCAFAFLRETTCHPGTACGMTAFIGANLLRLAATALFVFSFIGISVRRVRDAGGPGWLGLLVPILLVVDYPLFGYLELTVIRLTTTNHASISSAFPLTSILSLICIAILCVLPSRSNGSSPDRALREVWSAALSWIGWPEELPVLPIKWLVILAFVLTTAAFVLALPRLFSLYLMLALFMSMAVTTILPTFLLYFSLLFSAFLVVKLQTRRSAIFLVLTMLPMAHWIYAHWEPSIVHRRETAEIAAIPTVSLGHVPATIVVESSLARGLPSVWTIPAIEQAIYKPTNYQMLLRFDRQAGPGPRPLPRSVDSLPDEYLLLKVGSTSAFARNRRLPDSGGPLELRFVDSQHNDLIAIWYSSVSPPPSMIPLLTIRGWQPQPIDEQLYDIEPNVRQFLGEALGRSR